MEKAVDELMADNNKEHQPRTVADSHPPQYINCDCCGAMAGEPVKLTILAVAITLIIGALGVQNVKLKHQLIIKQSIIDMYESGPHKGVRDHLRKEGRE